MVYAFVLILLVYCWYRYEVIHAVSGREFFYWLEFVVLVLVAGLRFRVGGDTLSYMDNYASLDAAYEFSNYSFKYSSNGLLWYGIIAICQKLSDSFVLVQFVIAAFVNYAFFKFAKDKCCYPFLAVLLYSIFFFFYLNMEILRASFVVSIFLLWGFDALCQKKLFKYVICTLIAANFHIEGLFLLVFPMSYFLGNIKVKANTIILLFAIAFVTLFIVDQFPVISWFLSQSEALEHRGALYGVMLQNRNINYYLAKVLLIAPTAVAICFIDRLKTKENIKIMKGLMIIYIFFMIQAINFPVYFSRFCDCLMPVSSVIIANVIGEIKYSKRDIAIGFLLFTLFVGCFQYRDETYYKYFPYHSIINPVIEPNRENLIFY